MLILMILVVLLVAVTMFALQNVTAGSLRFLHWDLGSLSRPQRKGRGRP
jgi:hypothetical protein